MVDGSRWHRRWNALDLRQIRAARWEVSAELTRRCGRYVPVRALLVTHASRDAVRRAVGVDFALSRDVGKWLRTLPRELLGDEAADLHRHVRAVAEENSDRRV